MAVNQKAIGALENIKSPSLRIAPYMPGREKPVTSKEDSKEKESTSTGFTAAEPLVEDNNYAKVVTENVTAPYSLPDDGSDMGYVAGLNQLDLDWTNPAHRQKLLEIQRSVEWNGKGSGISTAGAAGPAQFMADTWEDMKRLGVVPRNASRFNEKWAKVAQEYYMDSLYNSKAVQSAKTEADKIKRMIAAYNAGIGNLGKSLEKARNLKDEDNWFKYLPKTSETIPYLSKILRNYKEKQPLIMVRKLGGVLYKQ